MSDRTDALKGWEHDESYVYRVDNHEYLKVYKLGNAYVVDHNVGWNTTTRTLASMTLIEALDEAYEWWKRR